jgi:hypothetical protein
MCVRLLRFAGHVSYLNVHVDVRYSESKGCMIAVLEDYSLLEAFHSGF